MKIALLGYEIENASAYRYLVREHPDAEFTVYDQAAAPKIELPEGVGFVGGVAEFRDIDADVLVRTPGIAPYKIKTDRPVTSATKLFLEACHQPIIGVTGSKGKGTTSSLIAEILRQANKTVWLVGNIGIPALDVLHELQDGDIVVYEMSSFQLWDVTQSPGTAVVLMIEPEHLDVHSSIEDYVNAKSNIARFQTTGDRLIYNANNEYSKQIAATSKGELTAYPDPHAAHVDTGSFYYGTTEICPVRELRLPGEHNIDNALAAIDAVWPWVKDDPVVIPAAMREFTGLPHRLKLVGDYDDVKYYDDSIATTPGSAIAAIKSFSEPKIVILGGSYKGANFDELARVVKEGGVRQIILIGDEAGRIETALTGVGFHDTLNVHSQKSLAEIVALARSQPHPGDSVILSPACASFGMFKNYADRGDQFMKAVSTLGA